MSTPVKKRRISKACDSCRTKRIKCVPSSVAPDHPCDNCVTASNASNCTFSRPSKKRGPQPGQCRLLNDKLATLESLVGYLIECDPNTVTRVNAFFEEQKISPSAMETYQTTYYMSEVPIQLMNSPPVETKSKKSKSTDVVKQMSFTPPSLSLGLLPLIEDPITQILNVLESSKDKVLSIFQETIHHSMPIFTDLFSSLSLSTRSAASTTSEELLLAVFTLASSYAPQNTIPNIEESTREALYKALPAPTIHTAQSALLLAVYSWSQGNQESAWNYSGLSVSLALNLCLHQSHGSDELSRKKRNIFYGIASTHALVSLRMNRTPLLGMDDYIVSEEADIFELERFIDLGSEKFPPEPKDIQMTAFEQHTKLCQIGLGIAKWSADVENRTEMEKEELIRKLVQWDQGLSASLKVNPSAPDRKNYDLQLMYLTFYLYLEPSDDVVRNELNQTLNNYGEIFGFKNALPFIGVTLHNILLNTTDDSSSRAFEVACVHLLTVFPIPTYNMQNLHLLKLEIQGQQTVSLDLPSLISS